MLESLVPPAPVPPLQALKASAQEMTHNFFISDDLQASIQKQASKKGKGMPLEDDVVAAVVYRYKRQLPVLLEIFVDLFYFGGKMRQLLVVLHELGQVIDALGVIVADGNNMNGDKI